jgi:ABC-type transporter Mla maintaining outer membrane lipid asymmetry ATPase subunit MlaF
MRAIIGLVRRDAGKIEVFGTDLAGASEAEHVAIGRRWGVLFQQGALFSSLSALENVAVPLREHTRLPRRVVNDLARLKLDLVGLPAEAAARLPGQLSGGMIKRVALARALALDPEIVFLDEPTAGLDPKQIIETRELIKRLAGNHTIILSTHILPEVSQTCQRVVIINRGRVVAVDSPENLTARLRGSETIFLQVDGPEAALTSALEQTTGVSGVRVAQRHNGTIDLEVESERGDDVRRQLANTVVSNGWGLLELRAERMSLEDIFLSLTTEERSEPRPSDEATEVAHD